MCRSRRVRPGIPRRLLNRNCNLDVFLAHRMLLPALDTTNLSPDLAPLTPREQAKTLGRRRSGVQISAPRPNPPNSVRLQKLDFGIAVLWCNLGTVRKIPEGGAKTWRKQAQTLSTRTGRLRSGLIAWEHKSISKRRGNDQGGQWWFSVRFGSS